MKISFFEIANFRKLFAVRVELNLETTIFVGANNSGKTSAMLALRHFFKKRGGFSINDFTLSHREKIREIGSAWIANSLLAEPQAPALSDWEDILPAVDIWLAAEDADLHHVSHILPTLDWSGGLLGVRLRLQPADIDGLYREFLEATAIARTAKEGAKNPDDGKEVEVTLWPMDLVEFLARRLGKHFRIAYYVLDPALLNDPAKGIASPQKLSSGAVPLDGDPFVGLMQIDEIPAQRGFGDTQGLDGVSDAGPGTRKESRKLAAQFRDYFSRHLDPNDKPVPADVLALKAIEDAQKAYDDRLKTSFSGPLKEMEELGYPGVTDPRVKISTRLRPTDGLDHDAAVQYEVAAMKGVAAAVLPEDHNGLGYQNLISMVFRLMSFRDAWMRVGKAQEAEEHAESTVIPPIHLVLIEEPEAHLHAQVQQVFIRKAYGVLRKHGLLGEAKRFSTQLVVSSHSSHIAHEVDFACLRYFRRLPAGYPGPNGPTASVPISTVINLTDAFGDETETSRFAKRYLRATHCDLFFADAAIFVEGAAERMLLPHFVVKEFHYLSQCYITWLEVGGSHAHRLKPLIDRLGLLTLIVTDLDAGDPANRRKATRPEKGKGLATNNTTLKTWLPQKATIDELLGLTPEHKVAEHEPLFAVRVAYQVPITVDHEGTKAEIAPYTFEDAIVFENLAIIKAMSGTGMTKEFATLVSAEKDPNTLAQKLFDDLDGSKKAEFALDLLELKDGPEKLKTPAYIAEGLHWLEDRLKDNRAEVFAPVVKAAEFINEALVDGTAETITEDVSVAPGAQVGAGK